MLPLIYVDSGNHCIVYFSIFSQIFAMHTIYKPCNSSVKTVDGKRDELTIFHSIMNVGNGRNSFVSRLVCTTGGPVVVHKLFVSS